VVRSSAASDVYKRQALIKAISIEFSGLVSGIISGI
jgi:hypothetical protein